MPAERAPMRKVREVMRLRHALGVSERQIAITIGVSRSTVGEYLRRAAVIGITWPVPEGMDDGELERRLFTPPSFDEKPARPLPDWTHGAQRAEAARRDAAVAVGGISSRACRRLWLQSVLRSLSGMVRDDLTDDATGARACREAVRRLRWRHSAGVRRCDCRVTGNGSFRRVLMVRETPTLIGVAFPAFDLFAGE
jgi:hypothetical protein